MHRLPKHNRRNLGLRAVKPAKFEYFRPTELGEALSLMTELGDEARLLAGGQSLIPMMNLRLAMPAYLIDLSRIPGLSELSVKDKALCIGAMTRQQEILDSQIVQEHAPLLALAASNIGHVQTRSRGTIGGSLANGDPAAELSLTMVTLGATLKLASVMGSRTVNARDFFLDAMSTSISSNEIITEIAIPLHHKRPRAAFHEVSRRHGDFALVSVAVQRSDDASNDISVGVGAVATTPRHCELLSVLLREGPVARETVSATIEEEFAHSNLMSDSAASSQYRKILGTELIMRCIDEVFA